MQQLHQAGHTHHLLHILTLVSQQMAYDFSSHVPKDPSQDNMKQIPYTMSTPGARAQKSKYILKQQNLAIAFKIKVLE